MSSRLQILIAEDERVQREILEGFLRQEGFGTAAAEDGPRALQMLKDGSFDLLLTDFRMPGMDGIQLLKEARLLHPEIVVILFTAYGSVESAVAAMKEGAYDYLTKPIDLEDLLFKVRRVERELLLARENRELKEQLRRRFQVDFIVSASRRMEEVLGLVGRVAPSQATVLILGESGTGKELVARAIHSASPRAAKPMIRVNCAALPEGLLESELFGHEKGSFTGALARRVGRFEQAAGGTIFLDEIGDLSSALQVKLLRVLQEREFERLGGNQVLRADVRVIAATHRNLEEEIRRGSFREDLYYRLNVVTLSLPPLRQRREDIPLLIEHFLKRFNQENHREVASLSREAREILLRYDYPGNVRELENVIERAVVLCRGEVITAEDLPSRLREPRGDQEPEGRKLPEDLEEIERRWIAQALEKSGGVQTRAAAELGISERVLRYKIKKYRIKDFPEESPS